MKSGMRYAILISGGGTTAEQIILATKEGGMLADITIALVVASRPDAGGIEKALRAGIPEKDVIVRYPGGPLMTPEVFGELLLLEFQDRGVDAFGQHGWMPNTPRNVIEAHPRRGINQHPGALDPGRPDFGGEGMWGMRVHAATLLFARTAGRRNFCTEATVQFVAPELDKGAVVARECVPIEKGDDPASLQSRVLQAEHALCIRTIRQLADDTLQELVRPEPLIRPEEYHLLWEAKQKARILYPRG
ncbi:MAG: formyltransferase family protein [bacterium]|nr:formyltransferase family protein [bacterium]